MIPDSGFQVLLQPQTRAVIFYSNMGYKVHPGTYDSQYSEYLTRVQNFLKDSSIKTSILS